MKRALAIVLTAAVVGGLAGAAVGFALEDGNSGGQTAQAAVNAAPMSSQPRTGLTPEQIYRKDAPGVVVITDTQTETVQPSLFTPARKEKVEALGSGFVIDGRGNILTNDHVVQGASGIRVGFSNGSTYPATIVGTDPSTDLAVVHVNTPASVLHPLAFADSSKVEVGDPAYAIGNPFGLDGSMTAGIVSALGRSIQAPNGLSIPNAIQTDAPINHGNSGGPLLNRYGQVIGVNSQIEGGTVDGNVGVGFAIPSNTAKSIAQQLIANGHVEHAWLGVQVETIDPSLAAAVPGLPSHGLIVARVVKGSPAADAGLRASTREVTVNGAKALVGGDVIVRVDGKAVATSQQLATIVAQHKPGDRLTLQVVRNGSTTTVEVTLGSVPNAGVGA